MEFKCNITWKFPEESTLVEHQNFGARIVHFVTIREWKNAILLFLAAFSVCLLTPIVKIMKFSLCIDTLDTKHWVG